MKNDSIVAELTETLINNPAFAKKLNQLDVDQLRHQVLALAQLRLLKELTDGPGNRELIDNLMRVVKPLTALHLRAKDQAERRKLAEERANARARERRQKGKSTVKTPANPSAPETEETTVPLEESRTIQGTPDVEPVPEEAQRTVVYNGLGLGDVTSA